MIRVEHQGERLDVILDNPDRLNSQTAATWRSLAAIGEKPPEGVRVIVLRGSGSSFSSGLDKSVFVGQSEPNLSSMAKMSDHDFDATVSGFQRAFTIWRECEAIVIAAVRGYAIGAGFQLALAADIRIVSDTAQFSMRETSLGIVPDLAGTEPLLDIVGYSRALELCVTGRMVHAEEAARLGIATLMVADGELEASVDDAVAAVLQSPASSVVATKKLLAKRANKVREEQRALEREYQKALLRGMK